jgi:hypothetical protein
VLLAGCSAVRVQKIWRIWLIICAATHASGTLALQSYARLVWRFLSTFAPSLTVGFPPRCCAAPSLTVGFPPRCCAAPSLTVGFPPSSPLHPFIPSSLHPRRCFIFYPLALELHNCRCCLQNLCHLPETPEFRHVQP